MENGLTHFDAQGSAVMVDVTEKNITHRAATARGCIAVNAKAYAAIAGGTAEKGDVLGVARVAGILAAKKTADLIPLCHPLAITKCGIEFTMKPETCEVEAACTVKVTGQTGVEMEALTGATVALLTIYDMCKALDKKMELRAVYLAEKSGGKSGVFRNDRIMKNE